VAECLFVTDLHGDLEKYRKLFAVIERDQPDAVFLGGDLLPPVSWLSQKDVEEGEFVKEYLVPRFSDLRSRLKQSYPEVFVILGNDDPRCFETAIMEIEELGLWHYMHKKTWPIGKFTVFGYACVPPTPFLLKDWERYDVSRYLDPGCVAPTDGKLSVHREEHELKYATIKDDLDAIIIGHENADLVGFFHAAPYQTCLDRAALDGKIIEHVPLDVHIGSIAIRRFIEKHQPTVTLHGHVHESARLTGSWKDRIGRTTMLSASHDGKELALVRFELEHAEKSSRDLL